MGVTMEELKEFAKVSIPRLNRAQRRKRSIDRTFTRKGYRNGNRLKVKR